MNRRKPTKAEFNKFWSLVEAKQAQKKKTNQPSDNAKNSKE